MSADMLRRLQLLEDRAEITDVVNRYADAYRLRDADLLASCFTVDARIELGHDRVVVGQEEIVRSYFGGNGRRPSAGVLDERLQSTPLMANVTITLAGDAARCESMCLAIHTGHRDGAGRVVVRGTRNIDQLVRTPDGWRIAHRVHPAMWQFVADGDPLIEPVAGA
jgi:ketosteroid isomerase-like protein